MIKVFGQTDRDFSSNGDCVLNPLKAKVHKEDNGDYYLDLETGLEYVDYFVEGNIVVANTPTGDQAFRIGNVVKKKSKLSSKCYHVFYDSENYLIVDSYVVNKTCSEALAYLNNATEPQSEFTVSSDVTHVDSYRCVRKSFYEAVQTILERWGGHLVRDNFNIQIKNSIGHDNGIIVQYKKNLKDITCSENWDNVVTKILPVGRDGILLNAVDASANIFITSSTQYDLPYTKTVSFNQNLNEEDYPSEQAFKEALVADLRAQATDYLAKNCIPQVNYTLKANLEKLTDVGDVVEVIDERINVHLMTNVIAFDYDCIFGQYTDVQFGNFSQSLSGFARSITTSTENYINAQGFTSTAWNQIQDSGTKIAEININGTTQNVYAPAGGSASVSWDQTQNSGDKIAEVTINGTSQNVYSPNSQTFTEASARTNINSGETYPTIFGKIKKFFADLKAVAFSGSYNDLTDKPTIPTVNNATLTIQKNGTDVQTFTANASTNATANITVPTKTSDLTNDSNFVTTTDLNGKVSKTGDTMTGNLIIQGTQSSTKALTLGIEYSGGMSFGGNAVLPQTTDANGVYENTLPNKNGTFAMTSDIPTKVSQLTNDSGFVTANDKVTQTNSSGNEQYRVLFSETADDTTRTEKSRKSARIGFNPSFGLLTLGDSSQAGGIQINHGSSYYRTLIEPSSNTASYTVTLPSKTGTLATTDDVNAKVSKSGDTMTGNLIIQGTQSSTKALTLGIEYSGGMSFGGNAVLPQTTDANSVYQNTLPNKNGTFAMTSDLNGKVDAKPNLSNTNMNDVASLGNSMGMVDLAGTDANINPNGKTGWHHFINLSYLVQSSNMWQTQFANKAGTTDLWIRSRAGGSISSSAWVAPWARLLKDGDTMANVLKSSYKSSTWSNSWYNSAISLEDSAGSFGGWICGPTKNGRIAIQSFQGDNDKLYIGYATRGRTTNSNERQVCWNGATGKWESDVKGNLEGNADTATKATQDADGWDIRQKYVNVYNSSNIVGSGSVTVNDMAKAGFCMGMVKGSTDNPTGSSKWVHVISMCWNKGTTTSWISQIAMDPDDNDGMWYRTTKNAITSKGWTRVLDNNLTGITVGTSWVDTTAYVDKGYIAICTVQISSSATVSTTVVASNWGFIYIGGTNNTYAQIEMNYGQVRLISAYEGGSNKTSTATLKVYFV